MLRTLQVHGILVCVILLGAILSGVKAQSELACEDSTKTFLLDNGMKRTCLRAKKDPWMQCKKREMRENCPETCLMCPVSAYCRVKNVKLNRLLIRRFLVADS